MTDAGVVSVISKADEVDPVFAEVIDLLFGDTIDVREIYDISKMGDGSELHIKGTVKKPKKKSDRRERAITAGLSAVGAGAGALGLAVGAKAVRSNGWKATPRLTRALLPVEAAGLGGELMATKILHGDTKRMKVKEDHVKIKKALDDIVAARVSGGINTNTAIDLADSLLAKFSQSAREVRLYNRARMAEQALKDAPKAKKAALVATAGSAGAAGFEVGRRTGKKAAQRKLGPLYQPMPMVKPTPKVKVQTKSGNVTKADLVDYEFSGEISKMDTDKQLAFGWCSLSTVDGEPHVDLQGDYAPIEEIEKSAYAYVVDSRIGGDMHAREGAKPKHTSDLVESFIATPEKLEQMGIPTEVAKSMPSGWWVGFKVNDADQWAMVKDGRRAGFSIHGKGSRVEKALS